MEPSITPAVSPVQPEVLASRVIRRVFYPPYCNPPISNYRKFWYSNAAAFWASFRVYPGDGGNVNQLGSNPVSRTETAFQEVGFGYTFIAAAADYWFDVPFQAGPVTLNGAKGSVQLELLGSGLRPVVCPLGGPLNGTLSLAANLQAGRQYTLLLKSKVEITISCGERAKYGEVIARFPCLVVSYERPWGIEPIGPESAQDDSPDLEHALEALQADGNGAETLLQPVSPEDIARAGTAGFGGFSLAR